MEPDFRRGIAVLGNMHGVPVESPRDQLTASLGSIRPWGSPRARNTAFLRKIIASSDEDSQVGHDITCQRVMPSCPRAVHDGKRTSRRSSRSGCLTRVRSNTPQGKISNRNFGDVNQSAFHPVQLTGERRQLIVGVRKLAIRGGRRVGTVQAGRHLKKGVTRVKRSLVFVLLVLLVAVASFGVGDLGWPSKLYWIARGFAGLLAVICGYLYMRMSESVRVLKSPPDPQEAIRLIPLPEWQLQSLKVNASNEISMGLAEAQIFALATIYPAALRQRISERYEPQRRTMRHTVSMAIKIPSDKLGLLNGANAHDNDSNEVDTIESESLAKQILSIPLPVILLPKGGLNDQFIVYGNGDEILPAYSYSEYVRLAARVLHVLLTKAFDTEIDSSQNSAEKLDLPSELEPSIQAAEDAALRCILHRGPIENDDVISAVRGISSLQQRIPMPEGLPEETFEERWQARILVQLAAKFVAKLAYEYAIVVPTECRTDGRISLRYERIVIPSVKLSERIDGSRGASIIWLVRWSKDRLRFLLGARPVELTVPLENAYTCKSFHMTVVCPEGLYLRDQLVPHINEYLHNNARPTNVPPYCRLRRRLGQPYAHFYSRFFPEPKKPEFRQGDEQSKIQEYTPLHPPYLRLTFHEVPPASMFRAALVAVSTTMLIWLIGLVVSRVSSGDLHTDVPVFLLAFPAIVAAWMGFDSPGRRLFEGTLGARLSLIYSALCAIAGSGLFLIYVTQLDMLHGKFGAQLSILGIGQVSWGVLFILSALNSFYACYFALLRTWEFVHLSSRPITGNSIMQESDYVQY